MTLIFPIDRLQMYKRRFTEWGFRKSKPSKSATNCSTQALSTRPTASNHSTLRSQERLKKKHGDLQCTKRHSYGPTFKTVPLTSEDLNQLTIMTNVQAWSMAYFDSVTQSQLPPHQELIADIEFGWSMSLNMSINSAFKAIGHLLQRGYGDLAGRVTRKAFLLVEEMLALDPPAILWNLVEIMHYLVRIGYVRIFQMLLAHVIQLVDRRMPQANPLVVMLYGLRKQVALLVRESRAILPPPDTESLSSASSGPSSSTTSSSSSSVSSPSSSPSASPAPTTVETASAASKPILHGRDSTDIRLLSLLEKTWAINADVVMQNFDPSLFQLYTRLYTKNTSIRPPPSIISLAEWWFDNFEPTEPDGEMNDKLRIAETLYEVVDVGKNGVWTYFKSPNGDGAPALNVDQIRRQTVDALRKHVWALFKADADGQKQVLGLQVLAELLMSNIIDNMPVVGSGETEHEALSMTRLYAGHLTCALGAVIDLRRERSPEDVGTESFINQVKNLLLLREQSSGYFHPETVRDLWLLEESLTVANRPLEAANVRSDAIRRLEHYVGDIPTNAA